MGKIAGVVIFLMSLSSLWGIGWAEDATVTGLLGQPWCTIIQKDHFAPIIFTIPRKRY